MLSRAASLKEKANLTCDKLFFTRRAVDIHGNIKNIDQHARSDIK
jgi:hypothetical protein